MKLVVKANGLIDLGLTEFGVLEMETSLQTAVFISLFSDRRALPDDVLPFPEKAGPLPPNRRGTACDALLEKNGDRWGSRLWLLARAKQTEETRQAAEDYSYEALQWLIDDKQLQAVVVTASWISKGVLKLAIDMTLPDGSNQQMTLSNGAPYVL